MAKHLYRRDAVDNMRRSLHSTGALVGNLVQAAVWLLLAVAVAACVVTATVLAVLVWQ